MAYIQLILKDIKNPVLLLPLLGGAIGILFTLIIVWSFGVRVDILVRDVFAVVKLPPVGGFLSNLGAFVWCSTLAILVFTAITLKRSKNQQGIAFLICAILLTFWLLVDDFFMVHDFWFAHLFKLSEKPAIFSLFTAVLIFLIYFRKTIFESKFIFLGLSLGFNALSVISDQFDRIGLDAMGNWFFLVEDGFKFIGICYWCAFFASYSQDRLVSALKK